MADKFKLIAITPETTIENEIESIIYIIDSGFDYVHIRKPHYNRDEMTSYLREIPQKYYPRIKINDHFELAQEFNIAGLHINRRNGYIPEGFNGKISKSCHSVDELSNIDMYEYIFLSPIYDSICKQGYTSRFTTAELQEAHKTGAINSKVIALGGMTASRICEIKDFGFGGAAFLGYLFESENDKRLKDKLKTIINSI